MARQETWTKAAVESWSEAKLKAWRERRTNVNAYLYRFCAPGQDQTNGAFSAAEQRLLEQRVAEFKQRGWPLACWGLFSLAIPGRVGYQCAAQYRKTLGAGEQDGTRATAAESAACLAHHAPQIEAMWSSASAQRLCPKVDQWLQERQAQALKGGAGGQAAGTAAGAVRKAAKAAAPAAPRPQPGAGWCDSDSDGFEDALSPAAMRTKLEPAGVPLPKKQQAPADVATVSGGAPAGGASSRWPAAAPAAAAVPNPAGRTSQAASTGAWRQQQQQQQQQQHEGRQQQQWAWSAQQPSAAPQQPSARPFSSFAFGTARSVQQPGALPGQASAEASPLQQQLPAREHVQHVAANQPGRRGAASQHAGLGTGGHKANVEPSLQQGPASSKPRPKVPGHRHSGGRAGGAGPASKDPGSAKAPAVARKAVGSDSEEEFEPGSLRQAPLPVAHFHPPASVAAAAPKPPKASGKRKRVWRAEGGQASLVVAEDFVGAAAGGGTLEDPALTSIKLQPGSMPGWACRDVAPYCPAQPAVAAAAAGLPPPPAAGEAGAAGGQVVAVADALAYDLASLGGGFQGVLLNAHLVDAAASPPGPALAAVAPTPSPPQRASCGAAPAVAPPAQGITTTQLASLIGRIDDRVVASGILCVWADKRHLVEVVKCMAEAGFQYVESLTWVQLAANGNILQARSAYLGSSHLSLLLGRKGAASSMQLKHQRTVDVIFAPALPPGQCPDEARVMLETLLPPCGGAPRLLEVSLAPGPQEAASRPGWVKVVQAV